MSEKEIKNQEPEPGENKLEIFDRPQEQALQTREGKLNELNWLVNIDSYPEWKKELEDSEEALNKTWRVVEAAKDYGQEDCSTFFRKLLELANSDYTEEKNPRIKVSVREFIDLADKFSERGIPPQFLMHCKSHVNFDEIFRKADMSQEGVRVFTTLAAKKEFADFIFGEWIHRADEKRTGNVIKTSNDLFELASKSEAVEKYDLNEMISQELEGGIQYWVEMHVWQPIFDIKDKIPNMPEIIAKADEGGIPIEEDQLIGYIRELGQTGEKLFPKTFEHIRGMLFSKMHDDLNIADYFIENLSLYADQHWAKEFVEKAVNSHPSVAAKFMNMMETTDLAGASWTHEIYNDLQDKFETENHDFNPADYRGNEDEGFMESDPYEKHKWRLTAEQIKQADALAKVFSGKYNPEKDSADFERLGINLQEVEPLMMEISKAISLKFVEFRGRVESNRKINLDDRETIAGHWTHSGVSVTPLLDNVQEFVARYIVQTGKLNLPELEKKHRAEDEETARRLLKLDSTKYLGETVESVANNLYLQRGDVVENVVKNISSIVEEGFKRYEQVLEIDVPLYDKLYAEFDELREGGRKPLEVYLGRDGIYAWLGRRAQDLARRRKLSTMERKKKKQSGEILEINPKYVVYPRYFRDNISPEVKKQFLEQESISPDTDPLFYDTGYTGTIPEQMMRIMGFREHDIEKRIRLLSAPSAHRRVKGISENARSEVIEYIEHNAKTEEPAEGLVVDEKTGKIKHIARPTDPREQLYFAMIKQAIVRHYWVQERLKEEK